MYWPKCDILPNILFKTVNSTCIFSLKCGLTTNYPNTWA